ncbi:hypothetical protein D3C71_1679840 [compost metagenome]
MTGFIQQRNMTDIADVSHIPRFQLAAEEQLGDGLLQPVKPLFFQYRHGHDGRLVEKLQKLPLIQLLR